MFSPKTYYVLAAAAPESGKLGLLGDASVGVDIVGIGQFSVAETYFGQGGTAGDRTIQIHGVNFDRAITVVLRGEDGRLLPAREYYRTSAERLFATFDLKNTEPGEYDLLVSNELSRQSATILNGFEVVASKNRPELSMATTSPPAFRRVFHAPLVHFPIVFGFSNDGLNDVPAPIVQIQSNEPMHPALQDALAVL